VEILRRNSDYALRAMAALAGAAAAGDGKELVSARDLACSERLAEPHLRKLLQRLVRAGLVESVRGVAGGFRLARRPEEIDLLSAVEAVQGKLAVNRCLLGRRGCPRQKDCPLSAKLAQIQEGLGALFRNVKLADLLVAAGK
jgi:Rrf2 family iron-sulfur cluster assembly transcriptional regulator